MALKKAIEDLEGAGIGFKGMNRSELRKRPGKVKAKISHVGPDIPQNHSGFKVIFDPCVEMRIVPEFPQGNVQQAEGSSVTKIQYAAAEVRNAQRVGLQGRSEWDEAPNQPACAGQMQPAVPPQIKANQHPRDHIELRNSLFSIRQGLKDLKPISKTHSRDEDSTQVRLHWIPWL
jgi:hypothetical protein